MGRGRAGTGACPYTRRPTFVEREISNRGTPGKGEGKRKFRLRHYPEVTGKTSVAVLQEFIEYLQLFLPPGMWQ